MTKQFMIRATASSLLLVAGSVLAFGSSAPSAADSAAARYDDAHVQYEIGHFALAYAMFALLADDGHCDAIRMASQMLRHGKALYSMDFAVAPQRLAQWQRHAACRAAIAQR